MEPLGASSVLFLVPSHYNWANPKAYTIRGPQLGEEGGGGRGRSSSLAELTGQCSLINDGYQTGH